MIPHTALSLAPHQDHLSFRMQLKASAFMGLDLGFQKVGMAYGALLELNLAGHAQRLTGII